MEDQTEIQKPLPKRERTLNRVTDFIVRFHNEYSWPLGTLVLGLRPLHYWVVGRLAKIEKGEKVLEVGSGYPLYKLYSERVGDDGVFVSVDINPKIQSRSRKLLYWFDRVIKRRQQEPKEALVTGNAVDLPFPDNTFDVVVASNFTSNTLLGATEYIGEAYRILKPGGRFINTFHEVLGVPLTSRRNAKAAREVGFVDVKMRPGAPGSVFPPPPIGGWNWDVEARKPGITAETG